MGVRPESIAGAPRQCAFRGTVLGALSACAGALIAVAGISILRKLRRAW
jgi:hypothetical protein